MQGYTREELEKIIVSEAAGDRILPEKGEHCPACDAIIPRFLDLPPEQEAMVRAIDREGRRVEAIRKLRELTGCPLAWAKIWVSHPTGPKPEHTRGNTSPCPYCGKPLRTDQAKQCFHCGADWHHGAV